MNLKRQAMFIEPVIRKYKRGLNLEDGFVNDKPFVYTVNGDKLINEEDDYIQVTEDGSKIVLQYLQS